MKDTIKQVFVFFVVLLLVLSPVSTAVATSNIGNEGHNNGGGNTGNSENGGGNSGGSGSSGSDSNSVGGNNAGGNNENNGNGGTNDKSNKGGKGKGKKHSSGGKGYSVDKPTKSERKTLRETKLKNIKNKKNNKNNKSKDNLKNLILEIPYTDEDPYDLKLEAYEKVHSIQGTGWGEDNHKLDKITDLMKQGLNESLWMDGRHILSSSVFKDDMHAAQKVRVLINREKKSPLVVEDLTYIIFKVVQADMMLAYIGIEETKELIEKMQEDKSTDFEEHLDNAINHFFMGEELVKMGLDVAAIQKYNNAWNESYGYLMVKDASSSPNITIEIPANNSYTNSSVQYVSGNVDDVLVFLIENVNISIDGNVSIVPLLNGAFVGEANLVEGKNTIKVSAEDYFDNVGNASVNVTLDTIPPQINITGIEDGAYYNYNVSTEFDISDLHLNTILLLLDGKPYTHGANISEEGNHTLDVSASDLAGNTETRSVYFTIDKTAPDVNISYPEDAAFVRQLVDIKGDANDLNLDSTIIKIDGAEVSGSSDYRWDTSGYSDGSHTITLEAVDKAGNFASTSVDVTVDNTQPEVIIRNPLNFYQRQDITVDSDILDANFESLSVRVNGNEVSTTLPYHLDTTLYPDGNHTIEVYAFDKAGNIGAEGVFVNFDNTAPEINVTSPLDRAFVKHAVDIEGSVTDVSLLSYSIDIDGEMVSTAFPYMWDTFASGDGNHTIRINAVDRAGNTASKEITVTVDNTLPKVEIKFPPDGAMLKGVVDLTVDVFDTYLDKFRIFINGALVAENESNFSWNTSEYDDGAYIIELVAYDEAGNENRVSINVSVDNTVPVIDIITPVDNSFVKGAVSVDADIIETNIASMNVSIDGILISESMPVVWDSTAYPDGSHTINVYIKDTAGNEASDSVTVTVDNILPEVTITSPANNSALRGIVDNTADVSDAYLADTSLALNGNIVSNSSGYTWNTSTYPDGWYNITVTAVDMAENINRDEIWVEVDNTPPELWVNELTDNPTLEYPEYRINGTVEPGVALVINGSMVFHDGTFEYTTNVTEGVNTFLVTATDSAGNMVNWTKTRLVDTDNLPDYYEVNVTGTDPLDGDSDSSLTPENEADNGISDDLETFQSGPLPSLINMRIGTDPFKEDTDDDGLTDEFELLKLGLLTDPLSSKTNGVQDTEADLDEDGLTNLEEQTHGTDPLVLDTDEDGLSDKKEITVGSNPLVKDTDGDGLEDDGEFRLGTDPNNPDSDSDGIPDGLDTYSNQKVVGEVVTMVIDGIGDASRTTNITNASGFVALTEMAGSIGNVVDINSTSQFTSATISIPYNEAELGSISENDLKMYYIDETDHSITFLDVQGVDSVNNMVWGETNHFSTFGIVSYPSYMDIWNSGSNPTVPEYTYGDKINIKANVHNTGDADVNDNVLVYFYAGNPDAGGSYLGSATITGGISQGGAKTATLYGYTITSYAIDIYVKVDPLNNIDEKSELNNKAFNTLSIGPQIFDSDGDGLTDWDETNGMRTSFGIIKTDPNNRDTDGDGLSDAEEMGARYYNRYHFNSDPNIADSDNDGLIDLHEVKDNTCLNPFNNDSDGDTILDGNDPDPCGVFPPEEEISILVIARDFTLGGVLGDMGMPYGILEQPQESWSSPYYLLGHILSGILPIGDIRDIAENIRQGDLFGAAINAVSLIPIGDIAKVSKVIKKYIKYAPASKVDEIFVFINRVILDNMPASLTEPLWKLFGKGAKFTRFADEGLSISQIRFVAKLAGSFPGKSVDDVGRVIKKGGKVAAIDLKITSFNPTKLDEVQTIITTTVSRKIGKMNTFIKEENTGTVIKITMIKLLEPPKRLIDLPEESFGALYDYYQWEKIR